MLTKIAGTALAAFALAALLASSAFAQTRTQERPAARRSSPPASQPSEQAQGESGRAVQTPRAGEPAGNVDLSITARVTASELRFEKVPNAKVEFSGKPPRQTVWETERENLPDQVQPGVTYRNIGITLRITSVFADIERIVAEALGETPAADDARPAPAPPERPATPPDNSNTPPAAGSSTPAAVPQTPSPSKTPAARSNGRARPARKGRGR
jgi:hypothetical protein